MISLIAPSRSRPEKSVDTFNKWMSNAHTDIEFILSIDEDEPTNDSIGASKYVTLYNAAMFTYNRPYKLVVNKNRSCVDAINNAAKVATGDILIVVSDDFKCFPGWDVALLKEIDGREGWIMKTKDGIQDWIITLPLLHRKYYEIDGYIYHPGFNHMFADTYQSCVADIRRRRIDSKLVFEHEHYSRGFGTQDDIHKRNDATWKQGEELFIKLMKEFSSEELSRISDSSMKNWLRNKGVR